MIRRLLLKMLVSAVAIWAADYLLAGFTVSGGIKGYLVAGIVLGLLNALVRPVLRLVTLPLILLTLGLFTIVINMLLLWFAGDATGLMTFSGLGSLVTATLIISAVHVLLDGIAKK
jgi:putative membrane protein